jgi:hypothetical protein
MGSCNSGNNIGSGWLHQALSLLIYVKCFHITGYCIGLYIVSSILFSLKSKFSFCICTY